MKIVHQVVCLAAMLLIVSCASRPRTDARWFPQHDWAALQQSETVHLIPGIHGYQQTTEYTCGPAAVLVLARFYGLPGMETNAATELRLAAEIGSSETTGTRPEQLVSWLEHNGFRATLEYEETRDYTALYKLRDNIRAGIPTLVEWIDLGGHWVVAVGYDDRGTPALADDILILADSYDRYDDQPDGYTIVNAERFYWMWCDAFLFGKPAWRTMITAVPAGLTSSAPEQAAP